jgi:hypothetical protein
MSLTTEPEPLRCRDNTRSCRKKIPSAFERSGHFGHYDQKQGGRKPESTGANIAAETAKAETDEQNPKRVQQSVVSADGLEPSTHALKGHCSAN